jgi:tetratricopeptide (TPR) repeat protein
VQFKQASTDETLWSESYERNLSDIISLQNEVTRTIVSEIRLKLTPQEQLQFGNAPPVNPEAYDRYLVGKFYQNSQDKESNQRSIDALESAVALDPSFAAAYAELAQAYVWKFFLFVPNDHESKEKAFAASEKALTIDPDLAVAHLARGRYLWTPANKFQHQAAIREYRRALELNPGLDEARNQLALIYNHIGATDEALTQLYRAIETNPINSPAQFRVGETLLFAGKYEEALTALRSVPIETNRALMGHQLVWALWNLGRTGEATLTLNELLTHPESNVGLLTSIQAVMDASAGHYDDAEKKIAHAMLNGNGFGHFHHTVFYVACAYARMNKPQRAIELLEHASDDGFPNYSLFATDPNLDNLRQHPRFIALLDRLKRQMDLYRSAN